MYGKNYIYFLFFEFLNVNLIYVRIKIFFNPKIETQEQIKKKTKKKIYDNKEYYFIQYLVKMCTDRYFMYMLYIQTIDINIHRRKNSILFYVTYVKNEEGS